MKQESFMKYSTLKMTQSQEKNNHESGFAMTYSYCSIDADMQKEMVVKLIPANVNEHYSLLHNWMNKHHVSEYWQQAWSIDRIKQYLDDQIGSYHQVFIVLVDERPIAYTELYLVCEDPLGEKCAHKNNDWGWHLLIGPSDFIGCGLSKGVGHTIMSYLFIVKHAESIFCEPDTRNKRMINFTTALGHRNLGTIQLGNKRANLMKCSHKDYDKIKIPVLTFTPQKDNGSNSNLISGKA